MEDIRFPKRFRSVSAKLFSIHSKDESMHQHITSNKRISCQIISTDQKIKNPSTWFPRIRCRSTSSASSTFSMVFSSTSSTSTQEHDYIIQPPPSHALLLESFSSELEELYHTAKEEIDYATESQDSIYYEGDISTAKQAVQLCNKKYKEALQVFGDTTNAIKFKFRWETDLYQLVYKLNSLPLVTHSIYD